VEPIHETSPPASSVHGFPLQLAVQATGSFPFWQFPLNRNKGVLAFARDRHHARALGCRAAGGRRRNDRGVPGGCDQVDDVRVTARKGIPVLAGGEIAA
jgi:hypothetical protein